MSLPRNPLKRLIKTGGGEVLLAMRPARARALRDGTVHSDFTTADRWMLAAIAQRAMREGTFEALHGVHRRFWESDAGAEHLLRADWRFKEMFLPYHARVLEPLRAAIAEVGATRLVELGSGTGDVLDYIAGQIPALTELVGIDLNERLVAESRQRYPGGRLTFECGDARVLAPARLVARSALLTNGGVLEYFTSEQVLALYRHVARAAVPSVVALVESVHSDHDFARETHSRPYGSEMSYSHNYPHLVSEAGLSIRYQHELFAGDIRWVLIVAVAGI